MHIEGDGYKLTYLDGVISMSGRFSLMLEGYTQVDDFFKKIITTKPDALVLDIRDLEYLNSSGIKTVCVSLILEASEIEGLGMKILCSGKYTWQRETVPTFEDLMDNLEIVFE